jgi:hypothetical protein
LLFAPRAVLKPLPTDRVREATAFLNHSKEEI